MDARLIEIIRCPRCAAALDVQSLNVVCESCAQAYPRLGEVPILLSNPDAFLDVCRRQITSFEAQAALSVRMVREQMERGAMLPLAILRCERIVEALEGQVADVRGILEPLLPRAWPDATGAVGGADDVPGVIQHAHNIYRDWGWPADPQGENERALDLIENVLDAGLTGRTIVLGAGACRLAYDLHQRTEGTETLAVDIDPLLLAVAQTVVRGRTAALREANAEIDEIDRVSTSWLLTAPGGPIDSARFQLLLADGLEPPVAPASFDTVVTPWFIDLVPTDLREFMSTVYRVLKPGGRWINVGPLRYTSATPLARRFTREEVFDLAARAAFRIDAWRSDSQPYLVSKLSGRGTVEWVMAFAATKPEGPQEQEALAAAAAGSTPIGPAWLLFHHLPVPAFAGQESAGGGDDLRQAVLSAIDGQRSLGDLALIVKAHIHRPDLLLGQMRDAVRRYLVEIHPAARAVR